MDERIQQTSKSLRSEALLRTILARRDAFLRFLMARLGNASTAEDVLQSAYLKALEHGSGLRDDESAVAWFYRILRNSIADHYRRGATQTKALEAFAAEVPATYQHEIRNTVCACIGEVVADLKPEYRSAIERIDLVGVPVEEFAKAERISANNASVRLHRARKAVAKHLMVVCGACAEHKCLDCTCRRSQV